MCFVLAGRLNRKPFWSPYPTALQPKVALSAERYKSSFSFLKRLANTIHPTLRNSAVLKGNFKSSLINVSKTNTTLPGESGTGKQGWKICCFFSSFTLSATVNNLLVVLNPASFSAAKGRMSGGQTGCRLPHLRALNGSLHSWAMEAAFLPFFIRQTSKTGQMFLTAAVSWDGRCLECILKSGTGL